MAAQTGIQHLLRRELWKIDDSRFSSKRFDVSASRPMATFAAGVGRLLLAARDAFEMGVLVKPEPYIRMARFAHHAADVGVGGGLWRGRCGVQKKQNSPARSDFANRLDDSASVCLSAQ